MKRPNIRVEKIGRELSAFYLHDDKPIIFRDGTSDAAIIKSVILEQKEYIFPRMKPKVIYDIGANIGVVSVLLANIYPEAKIYSFEPIGHNFELLEMNASKYAQITPLKTAVASYTGGRKIWASEEPKNLGGFSTEIEHGEGTMIPTANINSFIASYGVPDLIKIDVEGAEWDILGAMKGLRDVKWITGELHGIDDFKVLDHLSQYFKIKVQKNFGDKIYHFHALSKAWEDFGRDQSPQS